MTQLMEARLNNNCTVINECGTADTSEPNVELSKMRFDDDNSFFAVCSFILRGFFRVAV